MGWYHDGVHTKPPSRLQFEVLPHWNAIPQKQNITPNPVSVHIQGSTQRCDIRLNVERYTRSCTHKVKALQQWYMAVACSEKPFRNNTVIYETRTRICAEQCWTIIVIRMRSNLMVEHFLFLNSRTISNITSLKSGSPKPRGNAVSGGCSFLEEWFMSRSQPKQQLFATYLQLKLTKKRACVYWLPPPPLNRDKGPRPGFQIRRKRN